MGTVAAAFLVAFAFSTAFGGWVIGVLRRVGARQTVSGDAPAAHAAKQGTPTMGGVIILAGLVVPVVIDVAVYRWHAPVLALLGMTLAFGLIGFLDDYLSARRGKNLGLKARQKLALQFVAAILFVVWLRQQAHPLTTVVRLGPESQLDLGSWYYPLAVLLIVWLSNVVNLMDGLDGLASGVCAIIAIALAGTVAAVEPIAWLPLFAAGLAGGCLGFLWYNAHPAQVFMGDTGSLPLGAALAGVALLGKVELPAQGYAVVPWAIGLSVVIQVMVFQWLKRTQGLEYAKSHRVFRRTPLHHHFEELGWPETRVVSRFWLVTAVAVAATIAWTLWR